MKAEKNKILIHEGKKRTIAKQQTTEIINKIFLKIIRKNYIIINIKYYKECFAMFAKNSYYKGMTKWKINYYG